MAITQIPEVWSARILDKLRKSFVYGALINRDYEGEIREHGDTVRLLQISSVTVGDYSGTVTYSDLTDSNPHSLVIDQKKFFAFKVDDVDNQFSALNLVEGGSTEAANSVADIRDQFVAGFHSAVSSASPDNTYGDSTTPITVGGGSGEVKAYDAFLELQQRLDEADVPSANRRMVCPPWFIRRLKKELGGNRASTFGDEVLANGFTFNVDGVQFFQSNNVPHTTGTKYKLMLGLPRITFADAVVKVEVLRLQDSFGDGVRGLYVYGAVMTHPGAFALGTFNKGDLGA